MMRYIKGWLLGVLEGRLGGSLSRKEVFNGVN